MRGRLRWPRRSPGWRWPCRLRTWRAWCLWSEIKMILKLCKDNSTFSYFKDFNIDYWVLTYRHHHRVHDGLPQLRRLHAHHPADQSEGSMWSRDRVSTNHSSPVDQGVPAAHGGARRWCCCCCCCSPQLRWSGGRCRGCRGQSEIVSIFLNIHSSYFISHLLSPNWSCSGGAVLGSCIRRKQNQLKETFILIPNDRKSVSC